MENLSDKLGKEIREALNQDCIPIRQIDNLRGEISKNISFSGPNGRGTGPLIPIILQERCVLIIDIIGFTRRNMVQQLLLAETLNMLLRRTRSLMPSRFSVWKEWEIYKGTGDGAIFVFGEGRNPESLRNALQFAVLAMKIILDYNCSLAVNALNSFEIRMALSFGNIFVAEDMNGNKDILGDAVNYGARLVSVKEAKANSILVTSEIYHNIQINKGIYYANTDRTQPRAGELSDFVLGVIPNANNFLYIKRKGIFKTKDMLIEVFCILGRIDGTEIIDSIDNQRYE